MKRWTALAETIDGLNDALGRATAWLAVLMVAVQFVVVVMRYVFGIGSIAMQESVTYMHALLFMLGAGYTLLQDGHVRVDIFYRSASPERKALVDLLGSLFFLLPVCALIAWFSWPYVQSSWSVFEGSKETSGIQAIFLLKTSLLLFAGLLALQGVALAVRSALILANGAAPGDDGERGA